MKKIIVRVLVFIAIVVLIFSPYLLVIDFKRFSPVLLLIWFVSIAYFLMMKRREKFLEREQRQNSESDPERNEKNPENDPENSLKDGFSQEVN